MAEAGRGSTNKLSTPQRDAIDWDTQRLSPSHPSKMLQNLLGSDEAELVEKYPLYVVCAWIGNSEPIAAKHYLQMTDDDFKDAVEADPCHASTK